MIIGAVFLVFGALRVISEQGEPAHLYRTRVMWIGLWLLLLAAVLSWQFVAVGLVAVFMVVTKLVIRHLRYTQSAKARRMSSQIETETFMDDAKRAEQIASLDEIYALPSAEK